MKKLTLKRSLELCLELWSWLRDNSNVTNKLDWPKWYRYNEVYSRCFACEYDILEYEKHHRKDPSLDDVACSFCPLRDLWDTDCTKDSSPYNKWCNAKTDGVRKKHAGIIADFCDKELNKIAKKGKSNAKKN